MADPDALLGLGEKRHSSGYGKPYCFSQTIGEAPPAQMENLHCPIQNLYFKSVLSACIQTGELHQPSSLKNSILATHPKDCLGAGTVYEVAQYILRNSSITDCHLSSRTAERTFKKRHLMVAIFNHLLY